jgi:DNA-binding HxlR family transcriptional regulator
MPFEGYGQFCPVAKAAHVLTERWTPLVVRELLCGSRRFNDLRRGVPQMSPTLLSARLRALEAAGVVEKRRERGRNEYLLTQAGEELRPIVVQMGVWGQRWFRTRDGEQDLDVALLMWDMQRRIVREALPAERVVVHFEFSGAPRGKARWWLVLGRDDVDLCVEDPGHDVAVFVATDVQTMTRVWMGDISFGMALRSGAVRLDGVPRLRRAFPTWLGLSVFAAVERPTETATTHHARRAVRV